MKRTLIHLLLLAVLIGTVLAPSALAQRRGGDREEARACERTYRDALRSARGLPFRQRRIRTNEARREHADCLRRARH
jgi:type II secretory pathway pseudopilin PulG